MQQLNRYSKNIVLLRYYFIFFNKLGKWYGVEMFRIMYKQHLYLPLINLFLS